MRPTWGGARMVAGLGGLALAAGSKTRRGRADGGPYPIKNPSDAHLLQPCGQWLDHPRSWAVNLTM